MINDEKQDLSITTSQSELENRLVNSEDLDELKNIIEIFNFNLKKKDILRSSKLSDIQDKISEQIATRIDKRANEFSNADLLNYFKVVQDIIARSDNTLDNIKTPSIQINQQNNVNIDIDSARKLNKESRDKVVDAVQSILAKYGNMNTLPEVEEVK